MTQEAIQASKSEKEKQNEEKNALAFNTLKAEIETTIEVAARNCFWAMDHTFASDLDNSVILKLRDHFKAKGFKVFLADEEDKDYYDYDDAVSVITIQWHKSKKRSDQINRPALVTRAGLQK